MYAPYQSCENTAIFTWGLHWGATGRCNGGLAVTTSTAWGRGRRGWGRGFVKHLTRITVGYWRSLTDPLSWGRRRHEKRPGRRPQPPGACDAASSALQPPLETRKQRPHSWLWRRRRRSQGTLHTVSLSWNVKVHFIMRKHYSIYL